MKIKSASRPLWCKEAGLLRNMNTKRSGLSGNAQILSSPGWLGLWGLAFCRDEKRASLGRRSTRGRRRNNRSIRRVVCVHRQMGRTKDRKTRRLMRREQRIASFGTAEGTQARNWRKLIGLHSDTRASCLHGRTARARRRRETCGARRSRHVAEKDVLVLARGRRGSCSSASQRRRTR